MNCKMTTGMLINATMIFARAMEIERSRFVSVTREFPLLNECVPFHPVLSFSTSVSSHSKMSLLELLRFFFTASE